MRSKADRSMSGPTSVARIAHPQLPIGLPQAREKRIVRGLVHEEPAQRGAALAGGADRGEEHGADHQVAVGAGRHDGAVVAAQLEDGAGEALRQARRHGAAHARAAGGADQRHAGIVDERLGGAMVAENELEQSRRRGAEARRRAGEDGA
jgi:hypothetical protein